MNYFEDSLQHLLAELERIDLLIAEQVARMRRIHTQDEQFRGLYIGEDEVDILLNQPMGSPRWAVFQASGENSILPENFREQIRLRKEESLRRGISLRLDHLEKIFKLDQFEVDVILVCLAVDLDLRYERLYAYLQDDVTKKRPSVDLVCNLLISSVAAKLRARKHFSANAPLFHNDLLVLIEDPNQPHSPLLSKYLKVNNRIVQYLIGSDELDEQIHSFVRMTDNEPGVRSILVNDDIKNQLDLFVRNSSNSGVIILHLSGPYGVGRQSTAEAVCRKQGIRLLVADLDQLLCEDDTSCTRALRLVHREARLQESAVYWKGFDTLLTEKNKKLFRNFLHILEDKPGLTFLAGETLWEPGDKMHGAAFARVELPRPTFSQRYRIWSAVVNESTTVDTDKTIAAIGTKFKFTGGQILDAVTTAGNLTRLKDSGNAAPNLDDIYEACRRHSNQKLATLARKISPKYRWNDIVLPFDRLEQLREICNYVKYREKVYGEWGFDDKFSIGKGLSVLFAGPSGTGKTMAAEIMANELNLELYKIDLSTVVSKYIGETEKNLARIFNEAETSNAILFFDEADTLFGKRSAVRDSHDRYANIEIGYLLQRMEEYEGVVILASNLSKNMDEAFVRRLRFTVGFSFPNEQDRLRIWNTMWPGKLPRNPDLDLNLMANRFELAGGNIKNIGIAAAFMAASDGGIVNMDHVIRAIHREYQKMGKVFSDKEFSRFIGQIQSIEN